MLLDRRQLENLMAVRLPSQDYKWKAYVNHLNQHHSPNCPYLILRDLPTTALPKKEQNKAKRLKWKLPPVSLLSFDASPFLQEEHLGHGKSEFYLLLHYSKLSSSHKLTKPTLYTSSEHMKHTSLPSLLKLKKP